MNIISKIKQTRIINVVFLVFILAPPHKNICRLCFDMKKIISSLLGILIGTVNILVGSCGGIVAVESLKYDKLNQTQSHASAIAVILPLTLISAIIYLMKDNVELKDSYVYLLPGLIGSIIGSLILPKIPKKVLSKIFSVFIIYAGIRMLMK